MLFNLNPTDFCEKQAALFVKKVSPQIRKERGQFFTPLSVAKYMAELGEYPKQILRVLDAGAGVGILSCAVCEEAANRETVKEIDIDAYENDPSLADILEKSLDFARTWLDGKGVKLSYKVIREDFILNASNKLWRNKIVPYDLNIGNPPYFKIRKNDQKALVSPKYVYGQPNIYSLFMGLSAELLSEGGIMVFITPRSYASGPYFRLFRRHFFKMMQPERIHMFESRKDAFRKDDVLQENIILKARKFSKSSTVTISLSKGIEDLRQAASYSLPILRVLHKTGNDLIMRLPLNDSDIEAIDIIEKWPGTIHKYGIEISTGPVVPFRAKELILNNRPKPDDFAPLIWMQNVHPMSLKWPFINNNSRNKKAQFIVINYESLKRRLLVKDQNLVILRRFSAKEQNRRLTAAPLLKGKLGATLIGIENHLNYIYKPNDELSEIQTYGLSALFNSSLVDRYFRISSGNTQVSATEIRTLPLPAPEVINEIGQNIKLLTHLPSLEEIDNLVWSVIKKGKFIKLAVGEIGG